VNGPHAPRHGLRAHGSALLGLSLVTQAPPRHKVGLLCLNAALASLYNGGVQCQRVTVAPWLGLRACRCRAGRCPVPPECPGTSAQPRAFLFAAPGLLLFGIFVASPLFM
jgi:hypothetical protein